MTYQHLLPLALELDRAQQVAVVVHSAAMEGRHLTTATRAELERFAAGDLQLQELVRRTRARYGLA
ncbi:antitoxin VbhA family protein [Kocuria sp. KH4]